MSEGNQLILVVLAVVFVASWCLSAIATNRHLSTRNEIDSLYAEGRLKIDREHLELEWKRFAWEQERQRRFWRDSEPKEGEE